MGNQTFRLNTSQWNRAAALYAVATKRTMAEAINKKASWIVRRALWYTPKADYGKMGAELGQELQTRTRVNRRTGKEISFLSAIKSQKEKRGSTWLPQFASDRSGTAPLLALIINKRRGQKGQPGLYGSAMKREFRKIFGARARSIGFLKSGWLPALNLFRRFSGGGAGARGLPPVDTSTKQKGAAKGGGRIATPARPVAVIWNSASAKRDHKQALFKYGKPALQRAYDEEIADLYQFLAKKMTAEARKIGIRTL